MKYFLLLSLLYSLSTANQFNDIETIFVSDIKEYVRPTFRPLEHERSRNYTPAGFKSHESFPMLLDIPASGRNATLAPGPSVLYNYNNNYKWRTMSTIYKSDAPFSLINRSDVEIVGFELCGFARNGLLVCTKSIKPLDRFSFDHVKFKSFL